MILMCVNDNGNVHSFKDVLAYECITLVDAERMFEELKLENPVYEDEPAFSEDEIMEIKYRLGKFDHFPNMCDLRWVIELVLEDRHGSD